MRGDRRRRGGEGAPQKTIFVPRGEAEGEARARAPRGGRRPRAGMAVRPTAAVEAASAAVAAMMRSVACSGRGCSVVRRAWLRRCRCLIVVELL